MKNKKIIAISLASAGLVAISLAAVAKSNSLARGVFATHAEHNGNHYTMLAPTDTTPGTREYWICCECHEYFLEEPAEGVWNEAGQAKTIFDETDDRYLPNGLGEYIDKTQGWTTGYDAVNNYFTYTNKTSGALRMYKNLTVSHNSLLSFKLKITGLENNFNWATGLIVSENQNPTLNTGSYMTFGKSSATTKYLTSTICNGSVAWNAPKGGAGDKIALADGVEYDISMSFDFVSGLITTFCNNVTSYFTMSANLKNAGVGYVGLYGSTMKSGSDYGEVVVSDLKAEKTYGKVFDNRAGFSETVDGNNVIATNKTDFGTRVYGNKVINSAISKTGTVSFTYYTNGLEYDAIAGKSRSNWCAGLMFATTPTALQSNGKFVTFGKTSGAPKRIASMKNDSSLASGKQSWNLAATGSKDIVVTDGVAIDLTIDYDFDAATFVVTGNEKTSTFPMPDFIKNAGKAYVGFYGSSMTNGYTYGELTISNLVVKCI